MSSISLTRKVRWGGREFIIRGFGVHGKPQNFMLNRIQLETSNENLANLTSPSSPQDGRAQSGAIASNDVKLSPLRTYPASESAENIFREKSFLVSREDEKKSHRNDATVRLRGDIYGGGKAKAIEKVQ